MIKNGKIEEGTPKEHGVPVIDITVEQPKVTEEDDSTKSPE